MHPVLTLMTFLEKMDVDTVGLRSFMTALDWSSALSPSAARQEWPQPQFR